MIIGCATSWLRSVKRPVLTCKMWPVVPAAALLSTTASRDEDELAWTAFDVDRNRLHAADYAAASAGRVPSFGSASDENALSKLELLPVELLDRIFGFVDSSEFWYDPELLVLSKTLFPVVSSR